MGDIQIAECGMWNERNKKIREKGRRGDGVIRRKK
jgi:hypothetical protein